MSAWRKRNQLKRLFHRQGGRCWWCGIGMVPPGSHKPKTGKRVDPRLCTFDHMDCRLSAERGQHAGEYRNVAACWQCNNNRNTMQQANAPRDLLWQKSGAYPLTHSALVGQLDGHRNSTSDDAGSSPAERAIIARVAQSEEQPLCKRKVEGSSPSPGTMNVDS